MDSGTIVDALRSYIAAELLYPDDGVELRPGDDLLSGDLLDSMSAAQLAAHMEELYAIEIAPTDFTFENFSSLDALAALVLRKRGGVKGDGP